MFTLRYFGSRLVSLRDVEDKRIQALLECEPRRSRQNPDIRVVLCQDTGGKPKLTLYDSAISLTPSSEKLDKTQKTESSWNLFASKNKASEGKNVSNKNGVEMKSNTKPANLKDRPKNMNYNNTNSQRKSTSSIEISHEIGEMMFGAIPLSYKGMITKIHYIKAPKPCILLSKLFSINTSDLDQSYAAGRRNSFSSVVSDSSTSSAQGSNATHGGYANIHEVNLSYNSRHYKSTPLDVRSGSISNDSRYNDIYKSIRHGTIYCEDFSESSDDDSVKTNSRAVQSSSLIPGPSILGPRVSTSPKNAFSNRRFKRFVQTSLENGNFNPTPLPSNSLKSEGGRNSLSVKHPSRAIMYSVGVLISLEDDPILEEFIFSHYSLIENKLHQLQAVVSRILCSLLQKSPSYRSLYGMHSPPGRARWLIPTLTASMLYHEPVLLEAIKKFINSLVNMYNTPRIQRPLWLNMSTFPQTKPALAASFLTELTHLLDNFDTESSNFLMSTIITNVLAYHLGWVPTVAPVLGTDDRNRKNLSYDPLWAQLSDLYGMIASQPIICRTIVYGAHANTVRRILFVLSYFIRCNEVFENKENADPDDWNLDDPLNFLGTNKQSINTTEILSQSGDESSPTTSDGSLSNSCRTSETGFPFGVSMDDFIDVPMPKSTRKRTIPNSDSPTEYSTDELYARSYGRSLMVGYCEAYQPDFVLMGLPKLDFQDLLESDLRESVQNFSLQGPISKSVCILANVDAPHCLMLGYDPNGLPPSSPSASADGYHTRNGTNGAKFVQRAPYSEFIHSTLHEVKNLFGTMRMPAESCLEYIEDRLRILYLKALVINNVVGRSTLPSTPPTTIFQQNSSVKMQIAKVAAAVGLHESDTDLIYGIMSTF